MVSDIPAGDGKIANLFFTVYLRGWARVRRWPPASWSSRSRCGSRGTRSRRRSAAAPAGLTADDGGPPAPFPPIRGHVGFIQEPDGLKPGKSEALALKGTVSRDFLLLVFFMNQFPPSPGVSRSDRFEFFQKFAEIFPSQGAPPVSTTPVANLSLVSLTPVENCHRYRQR